MFDSNGIRQIKRLWLCRIVSEMLVITKNVEILNQICILFSVLTAFVVPSVLVWTVSY